MLWLHDSIKQYGVHLLIAAAVIQSILVLDTLPVGCLGMQLPQNQSIFWHTFTVACAGSCAVLCGHLRL